MFWRVTVNFYMPRVPLYLLTRGLQTSTSSCGICCVSLSSRPACPSCWENLSWHSGCWRCHCLLFSQKNECCVLNTLKEAELDALCHSAFYSSSKGYSFPIPFILVSMLLNSSISERLSWEAGWMRSMQNCRTLGSSILEALILLRKLQAELHVIFSIKDPLHYSKLPNFQGYKIKRA